MSGIRALRLINAVVIMATLVMIGSAAAEQEPFRGQGVTMIVSSSPGGGTDIVARLLGDALVKHLPGRPNIIYKHVPGAGGLASLNQFYTQAKPDGSTFYIGAGNQLNPVNLRRPEIKYDPTKLEIIGGFVNPSSFLIIRKEAAGQLTNDKTAPVQMAVIDGTRSGEQMAFWGGEILKWNLKMVYGYRGTADMMLALQRAEVDMMVNNNIDIIKPAVDRDEVDFVAQTGMLSKGKVLPSSIFPNVPLIADLVEGKMEKRTRAAFTVWRQHAQIGKWFALPPGTSKEHVKLYRQAFEKAAQDPKFQKAVAARVSPDFNEMSVDDLDGLIKAMVETTDDLLDHIVEMRKKYR